MRKFDKVPKFGEYIGRYIIATYETVLEFFLAKVCPLKGCIHRWARLELSSRQA
jgi:hypothetical protein